jgi:hypothetical protein
VRGDTVRFVVNERPRWGTVLDPDWGGKARIVVAKANSFTTYWVGRR